MDEPSGGMATTPADAAMSVKKTVFVIPGMGGDNPALAALRDDWSPVLDCVLLDYPDWPILADPDFDMVDLLDGMIAAIRARAVAGPIILAGFSLGGFVGWAIALRLSGSATPVEMLFLLDANIATPLPVLSHGSLAARLGRLLRSVVSILRDGNADAVSKVVGDYIGCRLARAAAAARAASQVRALPLPARMRFWMRFSLCSELQLRIVRAWMVQEDAYSFRLDHTQVVVMRAVDEAGQAEEPASLGWQTRCSELRVVHVAGKHNSMLYERGPSSIYVNITRILAHL
jgi:thioesterase domain-containing protein